VAARGDEVVILATSGLYRSANLTGVLAPEVTSGPFIDMATAADQLAGVDLNGHVHLRRKGDWEQLAAPTDVVELAVMGDQLVALSLPERYTILESNGAARSPSADVDARKALSRGLSLSPLLARDPRQLQPSLYEAGPDGTDIGQRWGTPSHLPPDCHQVARRGRRTAYLCGSGVPASVRLSLDDGETLAPRSVDIDVDATRWSGEFALTSDAMTLLRPAGTCASAGGWRCMESELVIAESSDDGFTAATTLPWPHAEAPLLTWRPKPGAPRRSLRLLSANGRGGAGTAMAVEEWSGEGWKLTARHALPVREPTERGGGAPQRHAVAHRDEAGRIRILERALTPMEGVIWGGDWSYTTLNELGDLTEQHVLPRAAAAAAWGDHIVLWSSLGATFFLETAASPSLFRAEGAIASWTSEGLVSWSLKRNSSTSRSTIEIHAADPAGRPLWKLETLAGEHGYRRPETGASGPWFQVEPVLHGAGFALRSQVEGADGPGYGWTSLAPIEGGKVGVARRLEPASFARPLPACTADQRAGQPLIGDEEPRRERARVEVRGVQDRALTFRTEAQTVYGLTEPCATAWKLDACDRYSEEDTVAVLDGDRRSGVLIRTTLGREARFRLTCSP